MKRLFTLMVAFFVLLTIFYPNNMDAQPTATGGCSTVNVTGTPAYYHSYFFGCFYYYQENCALFVSPSFCPPKQAQYQLQRATDTGWTNVTSWQSSPNFSNIGTHGTYRVAVQIPEAYIVSGCEGGLRKVYDISTTQVIGYFGQWSATMYTNAVPVGKTVGSDNNYIFTESNPSGSPYAMDLNEIVGLDASASKNYNLWWLAICENSFNNCTRYKSNGWTYGTIGQFNLTNFWADGTGWSFNEWTSYDVQFVVENSQCINDVYWNVNYKNFFICAPGFNCRPGMEESEIRLGPNPAKSYVHLYNFRPDPGNQYELLITDLAGKKIKALQLQNDRVDISDVPEGMLVVNIFRDGRSIFTSKLIVHNK